jgi:hypothetical protein
MTMTINKSQRILIAAVVIAAAITVVKLSWYRPQSKQALSYKCFNTGRGWGYDIFAGDQLLIHQSINPEVAGRKGFVSKQEAEADARIVIDKIKLGKTPVFNAGPLQHTGTLPAH